MKTFNNRFELFKAKLFLDDIVVLLGLETQGDVTPVIGNIRGKSYPTDNPCIMLPDNFKLIITNFVGGGEGGGGGIDTATALRIQALESGAVTMSTKLNQVEQSANTANNTANTNKTKLAEVEDLASEAKDLAQEAKDLVSSGSGSGSGGVDAETLGRISDLEDSVEDLESSLITVTSTANNADDKATDAGTTANSAKNVANTANTVANEAKELAQQALDSVGSGSGSGGGNFSGLKNCTYKNKLSEREVNVLYTNDTGNLLLVNVRSNAPNGSTYQDGKLLVDNVVRDMQVLVPSALPCQRQVMLTVYVPAGSNYKLLFNQNTILEVSQWWEMEIK